MAFEWQVMTVAECASTEAYSTQIGPFGKAIMADEYVPSGVPVLRGINVNRGRFHDADFVFISEEAADRLWKFESHPGDVLLVHKGTLGQIGLMPKERRHRRYIMGNSMMRVKCDKSKLLPEFLYYWLTSAEGQRYIFSRVSQVGVPQLQMPLTTLRQASLPVPPIGDQFDIVQVLGKLDESIEVRQKANETLEAIARAIFKSWFVDFDPVRAKAEGREPEGMDAATAALFSSKFSESSMGPIPEGFEVAELISDCSISMGQSPPGSTYNEIQAGIPFYQGRADFTRMFPTRRVYCTEPTRFASEGDVLLSVRAPVGDINIALEDCAIGRGVAAIRHNSASTAYSWCLLKSLEAAFYSFDTEGTVFGAISGKDLKGLKVVSPSPMLVESYTSICEPMFDKLKANELHARSLTELRDTVLPRLISGKLRVPEAEKLVEAII